MYSNVQHDSHFEVVFIVKWMEDEELRTERLKYLMNHTNLPVDLHQNLQLRQVSTMEEDERKSNMVAQYGLKDGELENYWYLELPKTTNRYAANMFTDKTYGVHSETIRRIRNAFHGGNATCFVLFAENPEVMCDKVVKEIQHQAEHSYLRRWFEGIQARTPLFIQPNKLLGKETRKGVSDWRAKLSFFSIREFIAISGIATHLEAEYQAEVNGEWVNDVQFRVFTIPGAADRRYYAFMYLPKTVQFHLTKGKNILVNFNPGTNSRSEDWMATICDPSVLGAFGDTTVYFTRKWDKLTLKWVYFRNEFVANKVEELKTLIEAKKKVRDVSPVIVNIKVQSSDMAFRRIWKGLRHFEETATEEHKAIMMANDLTSLKRVDVFGDLMGTPDDVNVYLDKIFTKANPEQRRTKEKLRNLPGGIMIIQGIGGSGKTFMLTLTTSALIHRLNKDGSKNRVLVALATNSGADKLAKDIDLSCKAYSHENQLGTDKIVIRVHSIATEHDVFMAGPNAQRPREKNERPSIIQVVDIAEELKNIAAAYIVYNSHDAETRQKFPGINDQRLKDQKLSLGTWIATLVGLLGMKQKYAQPEKHITLRNYLFYYVQGHKIDEKMKKQMTGLITSAAAAMFERADVVVTTVSLALDAKLWQFFKPTFMALDEATRITDGEFAGLMTYNPNVKAFLLIGDSKQTKVFQTSDAAHNCFASQFGLSVHERFRRVGYTTEYYFKQQRCVPVIGDFLSAVFYRNRVESLQVMNLRRGAIKVREFNKQHFGLDTNIICINVGNGLCKQLDGGSKFNEQQAGVGLTITSWLIEAGFRPKDILNSSPYLSQRSLYRRGYQYLAEKYSQSDFSDMGVLTFDGAQGLEYSVNVMDLVVNDRPGFLVEASRLLVGASRGANGLFIIANVDAIMRRERIMDITLGPFVDYFVLKHLVYKWTESIPAALAELMQSSSTATDRNIKALKVVSNIKSMPCRNCNELGHLASQCPNPRSITCLSCSGKGHFARDCPKKPCRRCHEPGHKATNCPLPKAPRV